MSCVYAVLGAGRQGVAAAYDLVCFGEASRVILADANVQAAEAGARRVNGLLGSERVAAAQVEVGDEQQLTAFLSEVDAALSAVPYRFNLGVARAAVAAGTHLCDLGGNTDVVFGQLGLDAAARSAGISIVPDCGLQPGMGNTLAAHGIAQMTHPREVCIWVGGLPRNPRPPFNHLLTFNLEGLTNEYDEPAVVLRDAKRVQVAPFSDVETLDFPEPVGRCEAFITTGGTSTCPWTYEGRLDRFEEKTVRYPGHAAAFKAFRDAGLFSREPVTVDNKDIIPRNVYHALIEPKILYPSDPDIVVLRVLCRGEDRGRKKEIVFDLMDSYEPQTGFRAMERTTGFSLAIVSAMQARGEIAPGAVPLEKSVPPAAFLAEARKRGLAITEQASD